MTTQELTLQEALAFYAGLAKRFFVSLIPDEDELAILIERAKKDRDEKLDKWHSALQVEVRIQDPEDSEAGQLPSKRRRKTLLEEKGQAWGAEWQTTKNTQRKRELKAWMEAADLELQQLEAEIPSLENQLEMARETSAMRRADFEKADGELKKLQQLGPILLQQAQALKDRQRERLEAMKAASRQPETDADELLAKYQTALEEAQAADRATTVIVETGGEEVDLDEILAEEQRSAASNARMAGWMGKE